MKRLTLDEAIGQTLQAKLKLGEEILLRFTDGFVTLGTNYESYNIYDFTDGEDPLGDLHNLEDDTLDELHIAGFIDGHEKFTAATQRDENRKAWEARSDERLRAQYEALKKRFEPQFVDDLCSGCGSDVETPGLDKLCPGCQEIQDDADREATSCPSCGCANTGGETCDGCQEIQDDARREALSDEKD